MRRAQGSLRAVGSRLIYVPTGSQLLCVARLPALDASRLNRFAFREDKDRSRWLADWRGRAGSSRHGLVQSRFARAGAARWGNGLAGNGWHNAPGTSIFLIALLRRNPGARGF